MIYIVVEFDKELGVNGSTMEVMPDNRRDHEGNLCVLYPYYGYSRALIKFAWMKGDPSLS